MSNKYLSTLAFFFSILFFKTYTFAQAPNCAAGLIYSQAGTTIQNYDPSLPLSGSNPINNTITLPPTPGGLAVCANINGGTPSPTFYTTVGGNYYWWNGLGWTNTGHSTGNPSAVNIGGGGGFIYNLVGGTGQVYVYNGSGPGTLLVTLGGFGGGGPYDLVVDNSGNFYILKTTAPQSLTVYSPSGVILCSYNLTGFPISSAGGGFAIIGNKIYVHNSSYYVGTLSGSSISFTTSPSPVASPSDFGSCPFNNLGAVQALASNNGPLDCLNPTINAIATTTTIPASYTWSGPGILAGAGTGTISLNLPGLYTCTVSVPGGLGCPAVVTTSVSSIGALLSPTVTLSNTLTCTTPTAQLLASPGPLSYTYTWAGPGIISGINSHTATVNSAGIYTVTLTNTVTGCIGTKTISVIAAPGLLSIAATSTVICIGESAILTVTGTATSYTWNASASLSTTSGSIVTANPVITTTYTVIGSNGTCTTSAISIVSVTPIPIINISPPTASVCIGSTGAIFTATGASLYLWSPAGSLSSSSGSVVTANPIVPTIYSVIGGAGTCTNSATFTVNISPSLILNVSPTNPIICSGSNTTIIASGALSYTWTNSSSLSSSSGAIVTAFPNSTTIYTVTGSNSGCTGSQTFTVNVISTPTIILSANTTSLCEGEFSTLTASGASAYLWSPSSTLNSSTSSVVNANPTLTTLYSVIGTNGTAPNLCTDVKTINITVVPTIIGTVSSNGEICIGKSIQIQASGGNTYLWNPSTGLSSNIISTPNASPNITTTYTVQISQNGNCPITKTITIIVNPLPNVYAGNDTTIYYSDSLFLIGNGGGELTWIDGDYLNCNKCSSTFIVPKNNSCYVLQAIDSKGCENTDVICVQVIKDNSIFIPNGFTPNGDGLNDLFFISGYGITDVELFIYNRWGTLIFKSNDIFKGWDGKFKGVNCENGVYVYKAIIKTTNGKTESKIGHITLMGKGQ